MKKVTISLLFLICLIFNVSNKTYALYTGDEYKLGLESISRVYIAKTKKVLCDDFLNGIKQIDLKCCVLDDEYGWVVVYKKDLVEENSINFTNKHYYDFSDENYYNFSSGKKVKKFFKCALPLEYFKIKDPKLGTCWVIFNLYSAWEVYEELLDEFN